MSIDQLRQAPAPGLGLDPEDAAPLAPTDDLDVITEAADLGDVPDTDINSLPDGDRQLVTGSDAIDEGQTNDSDLGADVAGDIGPKHA